MTQYPPLPARLARLDTHLDDFLASHWLPATRSPRVFAPAELPVRLESYIRALGPNMTWRAYADSGQFFCAIARIAWLVSRKIAADSLEVCFLDSSAKIYSTGIWALDPQRGWQLESVPGLPDATPAPGIFPTVAGSVINPPPKLVRLI